MVIDESVSRDGNQGRACNGSPLAAAGTAVAMRAMTTERHVAATVAVLR
jgi:hypothetical protein